MLALGFNLGFVSLLVFVAGRLPGGVGSFSKSVPIITTNQSFIEETRSRRIDLNNVMDVFRLVFFQLPDEVKVYPAENYYYFKFFEGGNEVWGNFRFDVEYRQKGEISFAYFPVINRGEAPFRTKRVSRYKILSAKDGLRLKKINPFVYAMSYRGKSVIFHLNQLPQTLPANMGLRDGEKFVSRTFDESGFQLILLFDEQEKAFRFALDETAPLPDTLERFDEKILLGRRSGFAFYDDTEMNRKILIGIDYHNLTVNNYYDGPFDQLADNFVVDDTFKNYAELAFPSIKGKINRRGVFLDEDGKSKSSRLALQPHLKYNSYDHLQKFVAECRQQKTERAVVSCLTRDDKKAK